ncbi:MAG: type III PLP-dependent enzyme [Betaproteobacteria bacterium]|nr:type III PLP-dependent enzyme [Betaproteobacteria bacterium]MDH3436287.1 type III PLP-dependent enzyme [Betaproteobacteria bacterium]
MAVRPVALKKSQVTSETDSHLFDTHPEIRLEFRHVREALKDGYTKPFLLVDTEIVRNKVRRFMGAMPRVHPHYAVKANPDPRVLKVLIDEGAGFEIASIAELDILLGLGVPAHEVYYSNPMKSSDYIRYAAGKGVEWFVLDSLEELRKIVNIKPDAKLYVRIEAPNVGSDWPLAGKFGMKTQEVDAVIAEAVALKADLAGVTFHVGSQCRNPENWRVGIQSAKRTFRKMRLAGLNPRLLNIGGGYPVRHVKPIPSIEKIAEVVNHALRDVPQTVRVRAEPGRYFVSDAGFFVCRVVGTATRSGKRWMYWDAGVFGGVIETTEGLRYDVLTDRTGKLVPWNVAGPTCDSVDVCMRDEYFPEDLREGDFIYIANAGAYTTAYASNFNGFPLPDVRVI